MLNKKIVYFVAIVTSVALHGFGFKDLIEQAAKDLEAGLEEVARELESPSIERNQSQRQASPISTNNKGGKYSSRKTPSLEEQANAGDPNAQFSYALKQSKPSEMIKFLTLSADQGYAPALNKLGELYLEGAFLDYNTSFAEGKFLEAFEQGNAVAAYNLSLLYSDEDHQMLNEADAAKFLKEAAKLGLANAQAELGKSLMEDNLDAGLRWLKLASNAGSEEASYTIAIHYDGQEDDVQAYKYFSKTKNSEIADAHYYLGKYLLYGWGVQVDEKSAYFHAQKGADLGSKLALNLKATCLEDGTGVESDPEEAFKIFAMLAGEGMDKATYNLARCYQNGIGVEADQTLATKYYIDASELGYPYAHIYTGERLLIGNGIKKDFVKAKYYLEKAQSVEDDLEYNMYAASLLGNIYLFGKGVEVDLEKAYELYLSSESTARNSRYHLGWMYEKGIYVDADIDNAINYYKRDDTYPRPANRLGEIYSKGIGGTTINMSDALAYYATAAATVYPDSKTESANAQLFLARAFYHDSIGDLTAQEAYDYATHSVANGNQDAEVLAAMIMYDYGGGADVTASFDKLKKLSDEGSVEASSFIGEVYCWENGEFLKGYEALSLPGVSDFSLTTKNLLASLYRQGLGVEKDYERAFELYSEVAQTSPSVDKLEVVLALVSSSIMRIQGLGTEKSYEDAAVLMSRAYDVANDEGDDCSELLELIDSYNAWLEVKIGSGKANTASSGTELISDKNDTEDVIDGAITEKSAGPVDDFLDSYERAIVQYEKAEYTDAFVEGDTLAMVDFVNQANLANLEMIEKYNDLQEVKWSFKQEMRYVQLTSRYSQSMIKLSQVMTE